MIVEGDAREITSTSANPRWAMAAFRIGTSCSLSPEKLRATKVAPMLSASIAGSMGAMRLASPRLLFDPTSADAENWPLVNP